jgi:hypothetical protein
MSGSMLCENFVVDCPAKSGHEPLKMSIARYFDSAQESTAGVTLLFAHCIGSHKEQWAPTIEEIFVQQRSKPQYQRIREAYAFDRQNHGESAVLNADYLAGLQECICRFFLCGLFCSKHITSSTSLKTLLLRFL